MISILIPVYNFDIRNLVNELHQQAIKLSIDFEIVVLDDFSQESYHQSNQSILQLSHVIYERLPKNIGRGPIRRKLAEMSKHDYLLFLDCDVEITQPNFIKNYISKSPQPVIAGGIQYEVSPPKNQRLLLRWKYGKEREQKSAVERNKSQYSHFVASNLFILKPLFLSIPLDNTIKGYGHEDTLLGLELERLKTPILHIDNAVNHLGLDDTSVFLDKSISGVKNLTILYKNQLANDELKLIRAYEKLSELHLKTPVKVILYLFSPIILWNLKGPHPSLAFFDLFKLFHFIRISG